MANHNAQYAIAGLAFAAVSILLFAQFAVGISSNNVATFNQWTTVQDCTYLIFTDSTTTYTKNCDTGAISYSGTDDESIFEQTFTAMATSGGKVSIKCGEYIFDDEAEIYNNTIVEGEGWCTVLRSLDGETVNKVLTNEDWVNGNQDIVVRDLAIEGGGGSVNDGSLIFENMNRLTVENVYVHDSPSEGIKCRDLCNDVSFLNNFVNVTDVTIAGAGKGGLMCSLFCSNVNIIGNHVVDPGGEGIGIFYGTKNVNIIGNTIKVTAPGAGRGHISTEGSGVDNQIAYNVNIVGNTIEADYYGISILTTQNVNVANNLITFIPNASTNFDGIRVHGTSKFINIEGNTIMNASSNGIYVKDTGRQVNIVGNTVINPNYKNNAVGVGINMQASGGALRENNIKSNNIIDDQGAPTMDYGIYLNTSSSNFHSNAHIIGNNIKGAVLDGVGYGLGSTAHVDDSVIMENKGYNPIGLISTAFDHTNNRLGVHTYGSGGNFTAVPDSAEDYTVVISDILLRVTGGSGVSVVIKDADNNTFASALTSVTAIPIPVGYKVNITYSSAPTVTIHGIG